MFLQETYEIEDCIKYDTNSYTSDITVNINLPSEFILTWESNRRSSSSGCCRVEIGADDNNKFQGGTYASSGLNGLQERISGTWQTAQTTSNASVNTIQYNTLKYENGSLSYSNGSQTVSKTPTVSLSKLLMYGICTNGLVQNIKIKAL